MTDEAPDRFSEVAAETFVARTCFKTGPPRAVGIELEWLLNHQGDASRPISTADLDLAAQAADGLRHSRLSVEPGGQLELSSVPFAEPSECVSALRADLAGFRASLANAGLVLTGIGLDPWRRPKRLAEAPRYTAMETYFDRTGPAGRAMMCNTASVQINVDAGPDRPTPGQVDLATRWQLLHDLIPVLTACFANSPMARGRPTGWRTTRARIWAAMDPARTVAVRRGPEDPRVAWTRYALGAPVMCVPVDGSTWPVPHAMTFRDWIRGGGPRAVREADLQYHLTTLFPPVRPRGHLELRVIDAQRTDADWSAAFAFVTTLVGDPAAAAAACAALNDVAPDPVSTMRAARDGLRDPALAKAALRCFEAALDGLDRVGASAMRADLAGFAERYVRRGRCPADDTLAELTDPSVRRRARAVCPA
jgi:glutamate--cysteine ligase